MPKKPAKKPLKITPLKGRPMLHWVGKKPLDVVQNYPAQLSEAFGVDKPPVRPVYDQFMDRGHNLLFTGDNKEVLSSLLVAGFRGKVDLIYIDPPFDSGADYVRRVKLRGVGNGNGENGAANGNGNGNGNGDKILGEGQTLIEQAQYNDIWANDNYLQFMYERLILLRELLSEEGSIYLHCDWHKSHHLRFLLDEIFGEENFINEIVWCYSSPSQTKDHFKRKHDVLFAYSKGDAPLFNADAVRIPYDPATVERRQYSETGAGGIGFSGMDKEEIERGRVPEDWWDDIPSGGQVSRRELVGFPTQKPEALLERIIKASSNPGSIVLDCFAGSGTTVAVAEKLGRRWVAADLNKGAIQTTIKRLQGVVEKNNNRGFVHYRVNNYDFAKLDELRKIIIAKYGIRIKRQDLYFDRTEDGQLAKIVDLDKPLTRLDIQVIRDELSTNRATDERHITVFCNGCETGLQAELEDEKRKRPINQITVCDIQRDGVTTERPAEAEVAIAKKGKTATIKIVDYLSPTILARMEIDRSVFNEQIDDFRAQIDCVLFDTDYNGEHFNIAESDVPARKGDYVKGEYEFSLPRAGATVAVKIIDMLGEEVFVAK
ncbi:MAG: site-specific DNA-methyltransferase [Gammaproteobacteria bacterium]|nr:site-specific DNA-methyltransferase [Gammaproteobacteria bacterium]